SWTAQPIGKGPCSDVTKKVAFLLGYTNWKEFTSHALRRTAITLGCGAGMTMPQLKAMSGHKSDSALEGYIATSMPMKLSAAAALTLGGPAGASASSASSAPSQGLPEGYAYTQDEVLPYWEKTRLGLLPPRGSAPLNPLNDKRAPHRRRETENTAPVYNITLNITGDVSAPLSLFSGDKMPL
ncbi:hypothetical protein B484DRAFT_465655, partial [Ochromonadaceae sp. CCMP2298]